MYETYEECGGWGDFFDASDDLEALKKMALDEISDSSLFNNSYHIIDMTDYKCVACNDNTDYRCNE